VNFCAVEELPPPPEGTLLSLAFSEISLKVGQNR